MTEARLEIKPHVSGNARKELAPIRRELQRFESQSSKSMDRARRDAQKLERAYDLVGRGMGRVTRGVGGVGRAFTQLHNIALAAAAGGGAAGSMVDLLIGSNIELESARLTFRTLIGDAAKAEKLIQDLRKEAASTPFAEQDILEAGKRLLRSTGDNIELNKQLVRQAETLAALNPERTVTDAAEAILDAQLGEFERLKEFSIKLTKKEVDAMKKSGEQLGDTAVRAIQGRIEKLGATGLVGELAKSVRGRISTLRDSFRKVFQEVGAEAFDAVGEGVQDLQTTLDDLRADPQFKEDMRDLAKFLASSASSAFKLATEIPGAVRSVRDFVEEYQTALTIGAGIVGVQKITGGAAGRGAFALGKAALFGRGGGGAAGAVGALGDAQPVFVTNWPGALGGQGDFLSRNLKTGAAAGAGAGGPLTAAEKASLRFGPGGLVGSIGAGGVLGGAAIAGSFALAAKALIDATEGTKAALEAQERRLAAEASRGNVKARADRAVREAAAERRQARAGGIRSALDAGASPEQLVGQVQAALGRGASLEDINAQLAAYDLEAKTNKRGRVRFGRSSSLDATRARLTELDKNLQANPEIAAELQREGKLRDVMEQTRGLKAAEARGSQFDPRKLNRIDVGKIQLNVTVNPPPGATVGASTGAEIKTALEKQLTELTMQAEANQ